MSPWPFLRVTSFPTPGVFKQKPKLDPGTVTRAQAGSWQKKVDAAYISKKLSQKGDSCQRNHGIPMPGDDPTGSQGHLQGCIDSHPRSKFILIDLHSSTEQTFRASAVRHNTRGLVTRQRQDQVPALRWFILNHSFIHSLTSSKSLP